jgi:thiol-disulfide isomerase/thioredoxin
MNGNNRATAFRTALSSLALVGFLAIAGPPAWSASAPQVHITRFKDLPTPLPFPYDDKADAERQVEAATTEAASNGKLLLIELGANWCVDCRILTAVMDLPEVRAFVDAHYVVVTVDVGRMNRNLQIPARYGITKRPKAVPVLLVVNPATGRLVNANDVDGLVDARLSDPQSLADWLARWVP